MNEISPVGSWSFRIAFAGSMIIVCLVWWGPQRRMPLDYQFIWSWGLALSALWLVVVVPSAFLFRRKAFWLLIGTPLVVYWLGSPFVGFRVATGTETVSRYRKISLALS